MRARTWCCSCCGASSGPARRRASRSASCRPIPTCTPPRAALGADALDDGGRDLSASVAFALERYAGATGVAVLAADLPHVTAEDVRELRGARPPARTRRGRRRHDECDRRVPAERLPAELRARERGAPRRHAGAAARHRARHRHAQRPRARTLRLPCMPRVTVLAGGVGGARFARGLLAVPAGRRRHDRGQRRRRPRALGPVDLARPRHAALHADGPHPPRAGLGRGGRHARGDGGRGRAGRRRLVHPRRSRHRPAPRAQRAPARGRAALGRDGGSRAALRARRAPAARQRRSACARASSRRAGSWRSRSGWWAARAADPVRAVRFEGVPGARPAPGVLEAIEGAERIVLAPSNPFVSLDPILAVDGVRAAVEARRDDVVAITPMVGAAGREGAARRHARDARARGLRGRRGTRARAARGGVRARQRRRCEPRRRRAGAGPAHRLRPDPDARPRRSPPRSPGRRSSCERPRRHRLARASRSSRPATISPACSPPPRSAAPAACATATSSAWPRRRSRRSRVAASPSRASTPSAARRRDRGRRGRSAHARADPRRERADRAAPRRVPDLRDPSRLRVRRRRRRPLERGRRRRGHPAAARSRRLGAPAARRLRAAPTWA